MKIIMVWFDTWEMNIFMGVIQNMMVTFPIKKNKNKNMINFTSTIYPRHIKMVNFTQKIEDLWENNGIIVWNCARIRVTGGGKFWLFDKHHYVYIHMWTHACVYICVCVRVYVHMYVCVFIYVCIYIVIYTYIYIQIRVCVSICIWKLEFGICSMKESIPLMTIPLEKSAKSWRKSAKILHFGWEDLWWQRRNINVVGKLTNIYMGMGQYL